MSANLTKIVVQVTPNSRANEIKEIADRIFKVKVAAPPIDGQANQELIKIMAKYFKTHRRNIIILKGETGNKKLLAITHD